MNPYLQDILHNITIRLAKLEEAQSKKEWVGLTDEETKELIQKWAGELVFEVQAKLKEKNSGTA